MATETALAKAEPSDIAESPQYQQLLADCREIWESARRSVIEHMWRLGERIDKELPTSHEGRYGQGIILALERDGIGDRTKLWGAVKVYRTYDQASILDGSSSMLTWYKLRALVALPDDLRLQIEERIRSGELRTDDDVRAAINLLKQGAGLLPASPLGDAQHALFEIKGLHAGTIEKIWRRADPIGRGLTLRLLIPHLGLEKVDRKDAVATMSAIRQQLEEYERQLGEGE